MPEHGSPAPGKGQVLTQPAATRGLFGALSAALPGSAGAGGWTPAPGSALLRNARLGRKLPSGTRLGSEKRGLCLVPALTPQPQADGFVSTSRCERLGSRCAGPFRTPARSLGACLFPEIQVKKVFGMNPFYLTRYEQVLLCHAPCSYQTNI